MGVWCSPYERFEQGSQFEAHINFWKTRDNSVKLEGFDRNFVEVGIMLCDPLRTKHIGIFIPEPINDDAISDCGHFLSDEMVAHGIFNEPLTVETRIVSGQRLIDLKKEDNLFCRVHTFTFDNSGHQKKAFQRRQEDNGTLFVIPCDSIEHAYDGLSPGERLYFRFRFQVRADKRGAFLRKIDLPDRSFKTSYTEVEYVDFRLNEARTLPLWVQKRMRQDFADRSKMTLAAFLAAVPVQTDLITSSFSTHKMRLLEHKIWNQYVGEGLPNGMMVYHWKKVASSEASLTSAGQPTTPIGTSDLPDQSEGQGDAIVRKGINGGIADFSTFIKLQTRRSSPFTILKYLGIALLFGLIGNLVADKIWACLPPSSSPTESPTDVQVHLFVDK